MQWLLSMRRCINRSLATIRERGSGVSAEKLINERQGPLTRSRGNFSLDFFFAVFSLCILVRVVVGKPISLPPNQLLGD